MDPEIPSSHASPQSGGSPMQTARRRRRWLLLALAPLLLVVVAFALDRALSENEILRGVWVGDLALSGLTKNQAKERVRELGARLGSLPVPVKVRGKLYEISPKSFGFAVDVDATVERAFAVGRNTSLPSQLGWWLAGWVKANRLELSANVSDAALTDAIAGVEARAVDDLPFAGRVRFDGSRVQAELPRSGHRVSRDQGAELVLAQAKRLTRTAVELPLEEAAPSTADGAVKAAARRASELLSGDVTLVSLEGDAKISFHRADLGRALVSAVSDDGHQLELTFDAKTIDGLLASYRKESERPPEDASFAIDGDKVSVVPSRPGTLLSATRVADAVLEAASSKARVGVLPLVRGEPPKLSTEDALALRIKGLVSQFTTFHPCCQPRVDNIHRIADILDGYIVRPGEIVSLNAAVGPRTKKNGFVAAPTIEEGEMVDSLGGGVSQFATTFFNALLRGGYDILERQPHSYYFSRYPMGHEATLSWPKPDIIFKNDTEAGMLIKTSYSGTSITVKVYGDNGGRKVRLTRSAQFDTKKPPVELIPDEDVPPDEEKVKESGQIGWSVIVGRVIRFADGHEKEEKRKVIYSPRVRRVRVHPCRIPEGEPGYTGKDCPVPDAGTEPDAGP